jgi:ribosomal-protein-alanine N-acetyltransferase
LKRPERAAELEGVRGSKEIVFVVFHDETGWTEFPVLETERLILRQPRLSDVADVFVFSSDPLVQKYNAEPTTEVSEAEEIIRSYNAEYERNEGVIWDITLRGVETIIGMIGFHLWSVHNRAMLGYDLAHEF